MTKDLRLYAHCAVGRNGAVSLAAVNTGDSAQVVPLGAPAQAWVLDSENGALDTKVIHVNGRMPRADDAGQLYGLEAVAVERTLLVPAKSIAFVTVPARNAICH